MISHVKIIEMLFFVTFLMDQMKSSWGMEIIQWTTAAHFPGTGSLEDAEQNLHKFESWFDTPLEI